MSNVLKMPVQLSIQNLAAHGWSVRRIARELRLNRRTVARYLLAASKCTTPGAEVTTGSGHLTELADTVSDAKCTTPVAEVTTGSGPRPDEADPVPGSKCTTPDGKVTTGSLLEFLPSPGPVAEVAAAASRSKCEALREVIVALFERNFQRSFC